MLDFTLVSAAQAGESTIAHHLKVGDGRDVSAAVAKLDAIATAAANKENEPYYASYISLDDDVRRKMVERIKVVDAAPNAATKTAGCSGGSRSFDRGACQLEPDRRWFSQLGFGVQDLIQENVEGFRDDHLVRDLVEVAQLLDDLRDLAGWELSHFCFE